MLFEDKNILLIGGTGTIGRGLLELLLKHNPNHIRIFSRDEYKQFQLKHEMKLNSSRNVDFMLGDVRDYSRVEQAVKQMDYVFHVAALKHVEACENDPYEAVLTNVMGTSNVMNAAIANEVKKVVFASSDKAISPANTYGASKLIAERLVKRDRFIKQSNTILAIVRFGNIIGSRGSVIPLFIKQIRAKLNVTITDPNMSRFMMTVRQATKLTTDAMKFAQGGETFVLKMPAIRIGDLLQAVIEHTCDRYLLDARNIEIQEVGIRLGEKMFEELMTEEESQYAYETEDMFIIPSSSNKRVLYPGAVKASQGVYRSDLVHPITLSDIKQLLND